MKDGCSGWKQSSCLSQKGNIEIYCRTRFSSEVEWLQYKSLKKFENVWKKSWQDRKNYVLYILPAEKQGNMREWLSWWSATLPRSRPRVRVPSRALIFYTKRSIRKILLFSCKKSPKGLFTMAWIKNHARFEVSAHMKWASVRAKPRSTGPRAPSRALVFHEKHGGMCKSTWNISCF